MEAVKTSRSGGMCHMEERFWSCPKSSSRCKCGVGYGYGFLSRSWSLETFHIK